jgi:hypothetical protein
MLSWNTVLALMVDFSSVWKSLIVYDGEVNPTSIRNSTFAEAQSNRNAGRSF